MVKKSGKDSSLTAAIAVVGPEEEEKKRLRSLAVSKGVLRRSPASSAAALEPSKAAVKLDGLDIVKRCSQRKSRFLFSFPGLIAPLSAGKVGELADLSTKNPVLYLEFPQGRMKLFGTHVYPKNKYLTLQLTKSAKGVICEDCFESLIVFSDAWWIGKKEENPDELGLEYPEGFSEGRPADCDFKGGAGAPDDDIPCKDKTPKGNTQQISANTTVDGGVPEHPSTGKRHVDSTTELTPSRQSTRTAGKKFSYAEPLSEDDSISSINDGSKELLEEKVNAGDVTSANEPVELRTKLKRKRVKQSSISLKKSDEKITSKKGLVQATLSNLFEKVVDMKFKQEAEDHPESSGSGSKRQLLNSKETSQILQTKGSNKKEARSTSKNTGANKAAVKKQLKVQPAYKEEIEYISSNSENSSDEDWAA